MEVLCIDEVKEMDVLWDLLNFMFPAWMAENMSSDD